MKPMIRIALVAAMTAFVAACGSNVKLEDDAGSMRGAAPIESRDGAGGAAAAGAGGRAVEQVTVGATDPLNDPKSPLAKRSIYFDFDSFVIKDEFRGTVDAHCALPARHANQTRRDPGQHRRPRQPRIQPGARPEARRGGAARRCRRSACPTRRWKR